MRGTPSSRFPPKKPSRAALTLLCQRLFLGGLCIPSGERSRCDAVHDNRNCNHETHYGYNVKALSELLNVRAAEVRVLLYGQLPEERAAELKQQILKTGIPL
jgi:hypothetical protein